MMSAIELVDRMVGADPRGRLTGPGPHLYVFRTGDAVLCRCHVALSPDVVETLQRIALAERGRQREWPLEYGGYIAALASSGPVKAVRAGMLYRIVDPPADTRATRITPANADLLRGGLEEWLPDVEAGRPMYASVVDAHAVAICASVSAVEGAHAAGVETLRAHRGKGLAAQAVAAWARDVHRLNAVAFYGASFDNLPSQSVAKRLSMRLVGSEFSVECDSAKGR